MYKIGDTVLYGSNGVCEIAEITIKQIGREKIEYYVLKPVCNSASTLFVPTGNETLVGKMRYILNQEEVKNIIENIGEVPDWISDKVERINICKEIIASGDLQKLVNLVRLLRFHEKAQMKRGKHLQMADERILKEVEKMVSDEISIVMNIERSSVIPMILEA